MAGVGDEGRQVRIQLSTRDPDVELPDRPGPILVQQQSKRIALSTLVNKLLDRTEENPIPFDFFINDQLLYGSIADYLNENGLSAETLLNLEYVKAQLPPIYQTSFEHDEWVGSVDVLSNTSQDGRYGNHIQPGQERIVTGCYDGLIRIWNMGGSVNATSQRLANDRQVHQIRAAKFLSPASIVSAGIGQPIRVWEYSEDPSLPVSATLSPTLELFGPGMGVGPLDSLAVHSPSQRVLSASDDGIASLWSCNPKEESLPDADSDVVARFNPVSNKDKKRKTSSSAPQVPNAGPLTVLRGHSSPVSSIIFKPGDETVAYSVSQDKTLRTWDLYEGANVWKCTPLIEGPLSSLCSLPERSLLATGVMSARGYILLIDPRAGTQQSVVMSLQGHGNEACSLATNPHNSFGLVSGSADGTCRIWDIRNRQQHSGGDGRTSPKGPVGRPIAKIKRQKPHKGKAMPPKVLSVAWDETVGIVSGGEDRMVQVNRSPRTSV